MTGLQRIDTAVRSVTPVVMTVFLAFLTVVPVRMPGEFSVVPAFTLMAVFYWTIYRPDLMPAPAVFIIGLLQDLMTDAPLGLTALILVGTYGIVLNQRRIFLGKPFAVTWWGFMMVATAALVVRWLLSSILAGVFLRIGPGITQYLATIGLFPLVVWLFVRTHRRILPNV